MTHPLPLTAERLGLQKLERFIRSADSRPIEVLLSGRHLPKDSPLALPHICLARQRAIEKIQNNEPHWQNNFSFTFLAGEQAREEIASVFREFLSQAQKIAQSSGGDKEVYQMNFDLFPWTKK